MSTFGELLSEHLAKNFCRINGSDAYHSASLTGQWVDVSSAGNLIRVEQQNALTL